MSTPNEKDATHGAQYEEHEFEKPKHAYNDVEDHIGNDRAFKGDDSDGKVEWSFRTLLACLTLGMLYTGSQIVLYMMGGMLGYVEVALNATGGKAGWLVVSNTLAITAVAPFTGYLQDLVGRRTITLMGSVLICAGITVVATSHTFAQAVAGMSMAGGGAGICELTALAGLSDIVPVKYRGYSLALMILCILPFTPYVIYGQLLASHVGWRWGIWLCLIYNGVVLVGLLATYFPKTHPRMEGVSRMNVARRIDYVGAALSIAGLTLFLVALQSGGSTHAWTSAYVLAQLILGLLLVFAWMFWEWKFAKYPMVPREMFQGQRVVALTFFIAFVAGLNFYSIINFLPLSFATVYNPDPIQVGLKGLGYGISTTVGAVFFNALVSTRIEAKWILLVSAILMTTFGGALIASNPTNPKLTVALSTLASFGVGGILVPAATVALIVVPDSLLATTAALSLSVRTVGGSIGYTIYLNIFTKKITSNLPKYVAEYALNAGLKPSHATAFVTTFLTAPANITSAAGYTPKIAAAAAIGSRWAYAESLKWVWVTSIPFGVCAIIACALVPSIKKYQTNRIAGAL